MVDPDAARGLAGRHADAARLPTALQARSRCAAHSGAVEPSGQPKPVWLTDAGDPIQCITDYHEWLQRFEIAMRALPDRQRHSLFCRCCTNTKNLRSRSAAPASTELFRAAVQEAKIGPDEDIPHITAPMIVKYITDLPLLGLP